MRKQRIAVFAVNDSGDPVLAGTEVKLNELHVLTDRGAIVGRVLEGVVPSAGAVRLVFEVADGYEGPVRIETRHPSWGAETA